ncbi:MAG: YraN family protein [Clostridia bacterium]|nr:YraN family protein [Clostridia bacterium]
MIEFTKKEVGDFGEKFCEKLLKKKKKYKILAKNKTIGHLEADIIAYDKEFIIFVEVKTRRTDKNNLMRPADAVNYDKRTNLIKFAYAFVKTLPQKHKNKTPRIDVCEVFVTADGKKLKVCEFNYIENAVTR